MNTNTETGVRHHVALPNTVAARKAKRPKRGDLEQRTLAIEELELRDSELMVRDGLGDDATERKLLEFDGYASLFGRTYKVGRYEETIDPGAFRRSLNNPNLDVVLRLEHEGLPLARTTGQITLANGEKVPTLKLSEDDAGLRVRALLDPSDPDVQRLVPKYRRGDLKEMSFAFRANDDIWSEDASSRTIRAAELHRGDVSIVCYGASSSTTSIMRSEEAALELRSLGAEGMVGSLQDFAFQYVASRLAAVGERVVLDELEQRAGKVLSSDSMQTLQRVLSLVSDADDAVDEAQPLLADLMGVPNPDADEDEEEGEGGDVTGSEQMGHLGRSAEGEEETRRDFSAKQRQAAAKSGMAMPDGSFPIWNVSDLRNAIQAVGRASDPTAAKAHIKKRAAALGATNLLPEDWRSHEGVQLVEDDSEELRLAIRLRSMRGQL